MKPLKFIEIVFAGSNSVLGGIVEELGADVNYETEKNNYCWIIATNLESFGMIEQQCKEFLKLEEYIIVERKSMIVNGV